MLFWLRETIRSQHFLVTVYLIKVQLYIQVYVYAYPVDVATRICRGFRTFRKKNIAIRMFI